MVTPLMWQAFDIWEYCFRPYWDCPYGWDPKARKLKTNMKFRSLKTWSAVLMLTSLHALGLISCLGACIFSKSYSKNFSLMDLTLLITWTILGIFSCSVDVTLLCYSEDAVLAFNSMKYVHSAMINTNKREKSSNATPQLDIIGIIFQGIAITFTVYPYFLILFGIIFNVDPLYYGAKSLQLSPFLESSSWKQFIFILIRVALTGPPVVQAGRLFAIIVLWLGMLVKMIIEFMGANVRGLAWGRRYETILINHAIMEILQKTMHPFSNLIVMVLMGTGLVLSILYNYSTLKLFGIIPMPFYLYFPSVSILIPIIIQILLPDAGNVNTMDKRLQMEWKYAVRHCRNQKYMTRKLWSVQALKIHVGLPGINLFAIFRPTKATYCRAAIEYTITALLLI